MKLKPEGLEKLKLEISEFIEDKKPEASFDEILEYALFLMDNPYYNTPCEDCDANCAQIMSDKPQWKLWYCKNNR